MENIFILKIKSLSEKIFTNSNFIDDIKLEKIVKYIDFLKEENKKINLISRKSTDEEIVERHILSSLLFAKHIKILQGKNEIKRLVDIGSGSGFPSIILAICFPEIYVAVVDSIQKKIDFLYDTAKLLDLKNVDCFWGRIEDFGEAKGFMQTFDVCTARALGSLELTTDYSLRLLKPDGVFVTIKSFDQEAEISKSIATLEKQKIKFEILNEEIDKSFIILSKVFL